MENQITIRNKPHIIIPLVNRNQMMAADSITPASASLIILCILLAHRAQIRATLASNDPKFIQQLASVKWNAKQLAKSPIISELNSCLVIANTLHFELPNIRNLAHDEATEHVKCVTLDLIESSPDPKAKILNSRAINDDNIKFHRLALKARNIGAWQANPIFNYNEIIRNTQISKVTGEDLGQYITELHNTLNISIDPDFEDNYNDAVKENDPTPYTTALKKVVDERFVSHNPEELKEIIFDDAINLNNSNNLVPIEELFPSIQRTKPKDFSALTEPLPEDLLKSPLFSYASSIVEKEIGEIKKAKPRAKRTPKAKPKSN